MLPEQIESITELTERLIEKEDKIQRMQSALRLIGMIDEKKSPHLGRVRWSGISHHCIPCIVELAVNFGTNGEYAYAKDFTDEFARLLSESDKTLKGE